MYQFGIKGLEIVEPSIYFEDQKKFKFATLSQRLITNIVPKEGLKQERPIPFDLYCISMKDKLEDGICNDCGLYWPSKAAKNRHLKAHRYDQNKVEDDFTEVVDEIDDEKEQWEIEESGPMPVFENMGSYLTSPFVYLTDEIDEEV